MTSLQQVLNLPTKTTYEAADFFVSASNQLAFQWVQSWPEWPHHCLILYGPKGCGKTHLAYLWMQRSGATIIPYDKLKSKNLDELCQSHKTLVIEDIPQDFEDTLLFHLYNAVQQANGSLLITTDIPPQSWSIELPDLRSRIKACMWSEIHPADDVLLNAVIHKILADEQITVPEQVISYMLSHLDRSFEAISEAVRKVNRYAFSKRRKITLSLVREALSMNE